MLILKELKFRAIGRFVQEQRIVVDELGNLIQVDGENKNTGGSSGAAKSTIFNALDFLFGINSIPNSILQSRLTEEPIWVEGTFDYDGLPLTITRSKKLKIDLNGEVITGSSKLTEEKLDQIIAMPRHLFKPLLHKEQGERGFFLNFTPKETNDFLIDSLGLSSFKKPMADLDAKLNELAKLKDVLVNNLDANKTGVDASRNALVSLGEAPVREIDQTAILSLKAKADASDSELNKILGVQKQELLNLEMNRPMSTVTAFDTSKKRVYLYKLEKNKEDTNQLLLLHKDVERMHDNAIRTAQFDIKNLEAIAYQEEEAKKQAIQHAMEIKILRANICPKCEQNWVSEKVKTEEDTLLNKINRLKEIISEARAAAVKVVSRKQELEQLKSNAPLPVPTGYSEFLAKENDIKELLKNEEDIERLYNANQNSQNKLQQDAFAISHKLMRDKHAADIEQLRGNAMINRKLLEGAVSNFKAYDDAKNRYDKSFDTLTAQELMYLEIGQKISADLQAVSRDIEYNEELKRAVKSYLSCSFDEALETISEKATRLVRHVPNMANATVQLVGTWETKEGKIKEEVNAVLHLEGDENIDIRSLSGGERSAVDLAVDLSVIELIEDETNKGINVFILDEPFTGMDTVSIEMALEVLKNSSSNKKLIIVDHNPEVKQMVESSILVVREGVTSNVVQLGD